MSWQGQKQSHLPQVIAVYIYDDIKATSQQSTVHQGCIQRHKTRSGSEVNPQKVGVLCSHTKSNSTLQALQSDSLRDRLFQASWNRDSHTHMKQPCSFVNRSTHSSRQRVCVCVREQLFLGLWETAMYHTPTRNHSCGSYPFSNTCMYLSECFQHLCEFNRQDNEGY